MFLVSPFTIDGRAVDNGEFCLLSNSLSEAEKELGLTVVAKAGSWALMRDNAARRLLVSEIDAMWHKRHALNSKASQINLFV